MDFLERFNSKFGGWYEGLFGSDAAELRPKDVLRRITTAMEDNRKEGLDGKIYVPNKYVLELAVDDPDERDYLLSFLDEEELVSVLRRFMAQNKYHTRGPLDFTIAETSEADRAAGREKLRVKARFEKSEAAKPETSSEPSAPDAPAEADDLPTVAGIDFDEEEPGTIPAVAWAALAVTQPDGRKSHFSLTRPQITIGRSRNAGNDLILENDGMISKAHARLEREQDGRFVLYDLGSTNGVKVNGSRVDGNRILNDHDEILIGGTKLVFQQSGEAEERPDDPFLHAAAGGVPAAAKRPRLVMPDGRDHVLASETLIGRAITSDIIIDGPGVATRHARIVAADLRTCVLEPLARDHATLLNGRHVPLGQSAPLRDGDIILLGTVSLRFAGGDS